jgi:NAD(P)H dehydrogenase (quinone)
MTVNRGSRPAMKISVILAHPRPGSFNHAVAETVCKTLSDSGHEVRFHDLYAGQFDPVLPAGEISRDAILPAPVAQHCTELAAADGIIFIHPNWWGQPPAILKGWIDRVIRPGVAYQFLDGDAGEGVPEGLLRARAAIVFNTSNTPRDRELAVFGDPLEQLWNACICSFCGIPVFHRKMFGVIVTSTEEQRKVWLTEAADLVRQVFPPAIEP